MKGLIDCPNIEGWVAIKLQSHGSIGTNGLEIHQDPSLEKKEGRELEMVDEYKEFIKVYLSISVRE